MSDNKNNYSRDSIEDTRRKKIDEFKRGFDKSVMNDDSDYDVVTHEYSDDNSYVGYSSDSSSLKRRRKSNEINSYSDSDTKKRIERDSKKALKQQSKADKKIEKNKARRNKKMFKWVWLSMVVIMGIVLSQVLLVGIGDMLAVSREEDPQQVKISIPDNASIEEIADILYKGGVIDQPDFFVTYANMTTSEEYFRQGEYLIDTDKDYEAIINFLQSNVNRTDIVTVQITEGMNIIEIADKLKEEKVIDDIQEFLDMCNSDNFDEVYPFLAEIKNKEARYYKLEGYLFPDTYDFYINEDLETVISKMLNNFEDKLYYTSDKYLGSSKKHTLDEYVKKSDYSMDEIITIASIIQAEAASKDDMYNISSILHNRLENGADTGTMQLACDSTSYYPYRNYKSVPENIKDSFTSKYDTYKIKGLPAGPICNPSLEAILAALDPNDTDYYYFCHSSAEDGSVPYYATNEADHNYNRKLAGID
ncbi:MAG: endolytic transglycosylase MltG [Eubacteriales bacterium]|nr:endolytic transglycosylase MltG [Eubacteriales bacterium]